MFFPWEGVRSLHRLRRLLPFRCAPCTFSVTVLHKFACHLLSFRHITLPSRCLSHCPDPSQCGAQRHIIHVVRRESLGGIAMKEFRSIKEVERARLHQHIPSVPSRQGCCRRDRLALGAASGVRALPAHCRKHPPQPTVDARKTGEFAAFGALVPISLSPFHFLSRGIRGTFTKPVAFGVRGASGADGASPAPARWADQNHPCLPAGKRAASANGPRSEKCRTSGNCLTGEAYVFAPPY